MTSAGEEVILEISESSKFHHGGTHIEIPCLTGVACNGLLTLMAAQVANGVHLSLRVLH